MHETLQCIVGTAIVDPNFREELLSRPTGALGGFDLTPEEWIAVTSIRADSIQTFARELDGWIREKAGGAGAIA